MELIELSYRRPNVKAMNYVLENNSGPYPFYINHTDQVKNEIKKGIRGDVIQHLIDVHGYNEQSAKDVVNHYLGLEH